MAPDDQVLDDIDAQLDWSNRLTTALPFSWWWRPDEDDPHVIMLCWPHGAAALEYGWRPGAADLYDQVPRDSEPSQICVACERDFDLQTGEAS